MDMTNLTILIDAAENSNWHAKYALCNRWANATGQASIQIGQRISDDTVDRAIEWAKRERAGKIAAYRARVRIAEMSPEDRQVMLLKGMIK
jgi:hypothetical protein